VDAEGTAAEAALRMARTLRLEDPPTQRRFERHGLGRLGLTAHAGLVVPLVFRGRGQGVLIAIDRLKEGPGFTTADERLLEAFAASAATAIATARTVQADRRRQRLAAAEQERTRWARELHDETLQSLAGLRLALAAQLRRPEDLAASTGVMQDAVGQLERDIASLRALITDLRPAALDDIGLEAAIEDLGERTRARGLAVDVCLDLAWEHGRRPDRLTSELETALYRIIQEALTNAHKHGQATSVLVDLREDDASVRLTVRDDGRGFDPGARSSGYGLLGIHERVALAHGDLEIRTSPGEGTAIHVVFPARHASDLDAA
jgi:signal transduction histidine kinase